MGPGPKLNTWSGILRMFAWTRMSLPAPRDKGWSHNVSQIMVFHDQEGKTWGMKSVSFSVSQSFNVSQWAPVNGNACHLAVITLQTLPMVNPEEPENAGFQAPDDWGTYQGNNFSETWLLHLPIHRKVLNFLTWDAVSWIWSSVFLSLQVWNKTLQKRNKKKTNLNIWNTGKDGRHSQKDPSD